MSIDETNYFDQKINEFAKICKELNFIKPDRSADTKACLNFLIQFDELQELHSKNSDEVSTPRNLTFNSSENIERVISTRNTAPADSIFTAGDFSPKGDE